MAYHIPLSLRYDLCIDILDVSKTQAYGSVYDMRHVTKSESLCRKSCVAWQYRLQHFIWFLMRRPNDVPMENGKYSLDLGDWRPEDIDEFADDDDL